MPFNVPLVFRKMPPTSSSNGQGNNVIKFLLILLVCLVLVAIAIAIVKNETRVCEIELKLLRRRLKKNRYVMRLLPEHKTS